MTATAPRPPSVLLVLSFILAGCVMPLFDAEGKECYVPTAEEMDQYFEAKRLYDEEQQRHEEQVRAEHEQWMKEGEAAGAHSPRAPSTYDPGPPPIDPRGEDRPGCEHSRIGSQTGYPSQSSSPTSGPGNVPATETQTQTNPPPSPGSIPQPRSVKWDIDSNVPEAELTLIYEGLVIAQDFLDRGLGGDIPQDVRANITIKVVSTGAGNTEEGGGGACCTGLSMSSNPPGGARPFFDVAHPHWTARQWEEREQTTAHEYAHGWQWSLGCLTQTWQPLGMWLNEGIAEQAAYAAMIDRGLFTKEDVAIAVKEYAVGSGEWDRPLKEMSETESPIWPGNIGYIALEFAMGLDSAPYGLMSIRTICEEVANGATREEAFQTTFGISLEEFYAQFEAWKVENPP